MIHLIRRDNFCLDTKIKQIRIIVYIAWSKFIRLNMLNSLTYTGKKKLWWSVSKVKRINSISLENLLNTLLQNVSSGENTEITVYVQTISTAATLAIVWQTKFDGSIWESYSTQMRTHLHCTFGVIYCM